MAIAKILGAALVASAVAGAAMAADLPSRKAPPLVAPPPVFTWTGLYVGFNYGYTWKGSSGISTAASPLFDTTAFGLWSGASALGATGGTSARLNGFFGGAQLGYNWQFANGIVAGLEADLQGAGVNGGGGFGSITPTGVPGFSALTSATLKRTLEHFGTVRGRLGYTVTPGILAYITGGLAYGGVNTNVSMNQSLNPSLLLAAAPSADRFQERLGWTLGAGAEMAISPNLSAKLEYLYYDLGTSQTTFPNFAALYHRDPVTGAAVGSAMTANTRFNGHILRTGLNYRFGGQESGASILPTFALVSAERPVFGKWDVSIMPYLWAVGMNGSSTAAGQTANVNMTFVDALTNSSSFPLEVAANMEARNGPISVYVDAIWMQTRMAGSLFALRNPIANANLAVNADARLKQTVTIIEAAGTLELGRWGYAGSPAAFTAIDAVAGLRYWRIGLDLSLDVTGAINLANLGLSQVGNKAVAKSGAMTWVDPMIGLRLRQQVDAHNSFYLKGDIGGFGAGSKFAWQAAGGYMHDFQFAGLNLTSMIGYRALYADYSKNQGIRQSGFNAIMHGPTVGVGIKF
jgi:opacity protein-like surface antigen